MYINQHTFVGHLGADATFREVEGGVSLVRFRVAGTKRYTNRAGQKVERTTWITVRSRAPSPAAAAFFRDRLVKGALVFVQGEHLEDERENEDGTIDRFRFLDASTVEILSRPEATTSTHANTSQDARHTPAPQPAAAPMPPPPVQQANQPAYVPPAPAAAPVRTHPVPEDAASRFDPVNW